MYLHVINCTINTRFVINIINNNNNNNNNVFQT